MGWHTWSERRASSHLAGTQLTHKVAAQPLEDGTGRTGPVIEACEAPAPKAPSIPANYLVMLSRLRDVEGGLTYTEWVQRCAGITESTFGRGRKYLVDGHHLAVHDQDTGRYAITEAGLSVLPRKSRGGIAEVHVTA